MRIWLALVLVLVPCVAGEAGRVATDYVRVNVEPDFQYHTKESVIIPLQVRLVRSGVPQPDYVHVAIKTEAGTDFPLPGGHEWLREGVKPYPHVVQVDLGRLEVGLYRVVVHAWGAGLSREWVTEFDVVYPPQGYEATLLGAAGKAARFVFEAHNESHVFELTVSRDSPTGRLVLEKVHANATVLEVPYVPGEAVRVDVRDEHGWLNAENKYRDWLTGETSYPSYIWNPDFKHIKNYQQQSWQESIISGSVLVCVVVGAVWWHVRTRP